MKKRKKLVKFGNFVHNYRKHIPSKILSLSVKVALERYVQLNIIGSGPFLYDLRKQFHLYPIHKLNGQSYIIINPKFYLNMILYNDNFRNLSRPIMHVNLNATRASERIKS